MPSEFTELFTRAAREVAPLAGRKGLSLSFDCRGPPTLLPGDTTPLHCSLYCLLCAGIDLIDRGLLKLDATVASADERDGGGCIIDVRISGAGRLAADEVIDEVLQRLRLSETLGRTLPRAVRLRHAAGRGPRGDAPTQFISHPEQGLAIDARFEFVDTRSSAWLRPARDDDAEAWLVDDDALSCGALQRRLQRLGWSTTVFRSPWRAVDWLDTWPHRRRLPGLLIVVESAAFSRSGLRELRGLMADATHCIYAVLLGDDALAGSNAVAGFRVQARPLGPLDLHQLALWPRDAAAEGTDASAHHPGAGVRPSMLVVDDNAVNRLVATGIGQCLGFETSSAQDGIEALAACRAAPPAVILMDIDMPLMDGLQATRHIRQMQRRGELPPCPIFAATSDDDAATRRACAEAGMDACLVKPLDPATLRQCLRRMGAWPSDIQ